MINFKKFNNIISLTTYFTSDEKCKQAIIESRWGIGSEQDVICPYCGKNHFKMSKNGRFLYTGSNKFFPCLVGTIFKNTKLPLINCFVAMCLMSSHNKGISCHQNCNYERFVNDKKIVDNDEIISKADKLEPRTQAHWPMDYVGQTFKFFGISLKGLPTHVLFRFEKVTKLEPNKTIMIGSVTLNRNRINGDGIIIDYVKGMVKYHERDNRYAYNLEIDYRYKQMWDAYTYELKTALDARQY